MGREISLFADFEQEENRVTNYCGLMFKMLYSESPDVFEIIINSLLDGIQIKVSPKFTQQERHKDSIPDLCISQSSFALYFETKTRDWFYANQIDRHLNGLAKVEAEKKVLFLLCNDDLENYDNRFEELTQLAKEKYNIVLKSITFEGILEEFKKISRLSNSFLDILNEFETYLDSSNLLPSWRYRLDVVSCRGTLSEIEKGLYACPVNGGAYSHRRSKYFGAYANKTVNSIYEIRAIVVVGQGTDGLEAKQIKWKNTNESESLIKSEALNRINKCEKWRIDEAKESGVQVFLLEDKCETKFEKTSRGGMMGSKQYFEGIPKNIENSTQLAKKLMDKSWKDWDNKDFWL